MTKPLRNHGDHGGGTAVYAVQVPQWHRASSVTGVLPVPETKFEGSEGERLGQLVVTPEVVANKISDMKENKSPGVDGIAPKILMKL